MGKFLDPFRKAEISDLNNILFLSAFRNYARHCCPRCEKEITTMIMFCKKCDKYWSPEIIYNEYFIQKFKKDDDENKND